MQVLFYEKVNIKMLSIITFLSYLSKGLIQSSTEEIIGYNY